MECLGREEKEGSGGLQALWRAEEEGGSRGVEEDQRN
jgi:hypothetical protein